MDATEVRTGLFIRENDSTYKISGVSVIPETGRLNMVTLTSADGVGNLIENTCHRENLNLAIPEWRLANAMEIDAWYMTRHKFPSHWTAD